MLDPKSNILTTDKVFVCISLFNLLRLPLTLFPYAFKLWIDLIVSITRITDFLNADELDDFQNKENSTLSENETNAVEVNNACFTWDHIKKPSLKNIKLEVPKGSLTAIVGVVGSGKSSLLQAIVGEMESVSGNVNIGGTISYVSQQAWIQNLTLKDNILFSQPYQEHKYQEIIDACALEADLKILSNGDQTEIGENGINLSGGQKQRVALARALYFDCDIVLLDDPLSAVDAHVGKHIFDKVVNKNSGVLKSKTVIWVTNQVSYLPKVDQIIFIKDGQICESGNHASLMEKKGLLFDFVQQTDQPENDNETTNNLSHEEKGQLQLNSNKTLNEKADPKHIDDGKLIEDETSLTGSVPLYVFKEFVAKMGTTFFGLFLLTSIIEQALHAGGIFWLSDWTDSSRVNETNINDEASYRLGVYSGLSIAEAVVMLTRDVLFYTRCAIAAKHIHTGLLSGIMRSPMQFFDTNPLGRIINRFSSDIDLMDMMIPFQISDFVWCLTEVVATLIVISLAVPIFLSAVIPIILVFVVIQQLYIVTSRQLKRLYSVSKSPIFSHFSETVSGAQIIRAFKVKIKMIP